MMSSTQRRTITCRACGQSGHTKRSKSCPEYKRPVQSAAEPSSVQSSAAEPSSVQASAAEPSSVQSAAEPSSVQSSAAEPSSVQASAAEPSQLQPKVITEDLGKIFEKAICDVFGIPFQGPYKYTNPEQTEKCRQITNKLRSLMEIVPPGQVKHTAQNGARYDFSFTAQNITESEVKHLSAKTSKQKNGKIAPQVIGQPSIAKFCEIVGVGELPAQELKQYIQAPENITNILQLLFDYTFSSPVVYYNEALNDIKHITSCLNIEWSSLTFDWTRSATEWTNSSTLRVNKTPTDKPTSLVEFQFHTKRKNMAIRWCFENLLELFADKFNIVQIYQPISVRVEGPQSADLTLAPVKKSQTEPEGSFEPKRELTPKRLYLEKLDD